MELQVRLTPEEIIKIVRSRIPGAGKVHFRWVASGVSAFCIKVDTFDPIENRPWTASFFWSDFAIWVAAYLRGQGISIPEQDVEFRRCKRAKGGYVLKLVWDDGLELKASAGHTKYLAKIIDEAPLMRIAVDVNSLSD